MIEEVNALGAHKTYTYDKAGNLLVQKDEDNNTTHYTYNARNLITKVAYSDGKEANLRYNSRGELVEFNDWNGTTSLRLDAMGRLQEITDHNNRTTKYTYDAAGNKASMIYPDGEKISYTYDAARRLTKVIDSDGNETQLTYDAAGNLKTQVNPNGEQTRYTYDTRSQLVKMEEMKGSASIQTNDYIYDKNGNMLTDVQVHVNYKPLSYLREYRYDSINRLTGVSENGYRSVLSKGYDSRKESSYRYDTAGNLLEETINGENKLYSYNVMNQLTGKSADDSVYGYEYDKRGNLVEERINGAALRTYEYDAANRLSEGTNHLKGETSKYVFNALGKRVHTEQQLSNVNKGAANNDNSGGNDYDEFVKLLALEGISAAERGSRAYSDNHGLTRQSESQVTVNRDYVIDYTSLYGNDIMVYENGGLATKYVYGDRTGKLFHKTGGASSYTEQTEPDSEPDEWGEGGDNALAVPERIADMYSSIASGANGKAYYHKNHLGSVGYVTNEAGEILQKYQYDVWGSPASNASMGGMNAAGVDGLAGYTGHDYDAVLDKYYAQARMYDADNKRFVAVDPGLDGFNWYMYCRNNPVNYWDPDGKAPEKYQKYTFKYFKYSEPAITVNSSGYTIISNLEKILEAQIYYAKTTDPLKRAKLHEQANAARMSMATIIWTGPLGDALHKITRASKQGNTQDETERVLQLMAGHFKSSPYGIRENLVESGKEVKKFTDAAMEYTAFMAGTPEGMTASIYAGMYSKAFVGAQCAPVSAKGDNTGAKGAGKVTGSTDGLTAAEKKVVNDLTVNGKNVEIIPKDPNSINKTPDFKIDGVKTELKSLQNPNTNTGMKRIQDGFKQGAETVIIDAREAGLTSSQAQEILSRAAGKYPNGQFPGKVEIWINGQIITIP